MTDRPIRLPGDSTWYIDDSQGFEWLPYCSSDYAPSSVWYDCCLRDPEGPICQRHRIFFQSRKASA